MVEISVDKVPLPGEVVYDGILHDGMEMEHLKQQDVNHTNTEYGEPTVETVSSQQSSSLQIVPWVSGQLAMNHPNNCETHLPIETVDVSLKVQPLPEFNLIVNPGSIAETTPSLGSLKGFVWQSAFKKRKLHHSFQLLKGPEPNT
ncbi:hypothetical protein Cni_G04642 [Canna indica]|uniref:Uncharacterized protein n=1 Tax=Canna indica TaxID=4628 RepID=A0AAQ3JTR9_9LILI|nr:hypothetical protein Cni_G04638 [Canna indica]WOK95935.1 hypothetical protein Cni_G04642 [Canna indica]